MGTGFGRQLRAARTERGLTHADLASREYAAGFVALVEEGRREPSPGMVRELAARLELSTVQLEAWEEVPAGAGAALLLHMMAARQAHDVREYGEAAAHAARAASAAQEAGKNGAWWDMTVLNAECQLRLRQFDRSAALARTLLAHPMGAMEALAAPAHDMLARTERGRGRIAAAVVHAREAVLCAASARPQTGALLEALVTLVGALADADELEEAWDCCTVLADLADEEPDATRHGTAHAAIGNVAFLRGDHVEGTGWHRRAGRALSAANDVRVWGEFNKAAAAARIAGGDLGPETPEALRRAELAYSVIGGSREDHAELALLHGRWLHAAGRPAEALPILRQVHAEKHLLAHHHAAQATLLLARALEQSGRPEEAALVLDGAADQLSLAGVAPAGDETSPGG